MLKFQGLARSHKTSAHFSLLGLFILPSFKKCKLHLSTSRHTPTFTNTLPDDEKPACTIWFYSSLLSFRTLLSRGSSGSVVQRGWKSEISVRHTDLVYIGRYTADWTFGLGRASLWCVLSLPLRSEMAIRYQHSDILSFYMTMGFTVLGFHQSEAFLVGQSS